jgi:phosphopantetheinyl transferase (holo-ACP synthase)
LISIGNDIVALGSINRPRSNDIRFHSKFITPNELALYQTPAIAVIPFESFVWLLWSVKEAVYKYQKRLQPGLVFSPIKIVVRSIVIPALHEGDQTDINIGERDTPGDDCCNGEVESGEYKLHFRSIINEQLIASIVGHEPSFKNTYWGIRSIEHTNHQDQSLAVRQALLNKIRTIIPQGNLTLQQSPVGYPMLFNNGIDSQMLISFAHHGHFLFYSFHFNS